jgi:hypothetical protein
LPVGKTSVNTSRPHHCEAIRRAGITSVLGEYDPHVAGTAPLGLAVPASDLDVLCHASDPITFAAALWGAFSNEAGFSHQWIIADRPVVASFHAHGWRFQIFGQGQPVREQTAWRHFLIERRLLELGGPMFRAAVIRERTKGMKTEPVFAAVLRLDGDPYATLLDLQDHTDEDLIDFLKAAGFAA